MINATDVTLHIKKSTAGKGDWEKKIACHLPPTADCQCQYGLNTANVTIA